MKTACFALPAAAWLWFVASASAQMIHVNEVLPNGTFDTRQATGVTVTPGTPLAIHAALTGGDDHFFGYSYNGAGTLVIRTFGAPDSPSFGLDTTLEHLDSTGNQLAFNDDYIHGNSGIDRSPTDPAGDYAAHVAGFEGSAVGSYTLTFFAHTSRAESSGHALGLMPVNGFMVTGSLAGIERDTFTFSLPGGASELAVWTTGTTDLVATLSDGMGGSMFNDDGGPGLNPGFRIAAPDSTYTLDLESFDGSAGDYTLFIEALTPIPSPSAAAVLGLAGLGVLHRRRR